jgi:amino acid adenylation domain-containing protein
MVVSELRANGGSKRDRFFDVSFNINTLSRLGGFLLHMDPSYETTTVAGLEIQRFDLDQAEEGTDIFLNLLETERTMVYRFRYNPDLFDRETIVRMQGHIESLLEAIAADPEQEIARLPLLTESESRQLLVEWNATEEPFPGDQRIQDLFEAQAAATPDAVALLTHSGPVTFGDLNREANRLAHHLLRLGVEPETRVGIFLPRTVELVVGVLGVLKAGATYLPLDPSYPTERLAFMLRDSKAPVVLTIEVLRGQVPDREAQVVCLDRDRAVLAEESAENPIVSTTAESAAYVLYTSGSTGLPKGVLGLHRGALNRFAWMWRTYPFEPGEVCCLTTTLNFVDAVWELFGPLLKGVPVVLIPEEVVKDFGPLVETLASNNVSRFVLVPSLLDALLENEPNLAQKLPRLKLWTSSGEALAVDLVRRFRAVVPGARLINLYGSSELAADVTCCDTTTLDLDNITSIPIGHPISNTQTYILDEIGQPVPIGVTGELYVGGANLARGYLDRPDLTAERFIPNPFRPESDGRLFRTGDRARYRADGAIEYVGRVDSQVKIRGSRVEPGEVEAVLDQHPNIRDVVVVADRDRQEESRLVAYVVSAEGATASPTELRTFLRERLPEFMIPSAFVNLDALPLTPNGKVDRLALPSPEGPTIDDDFEPPKTPMEITIAEIWQEALEIQRVGRHDNFFDLGGHSLMAMKVNAKLQRRTGVRFNVGILVTQNLGQVATIYEAIQRRNQAAQPGAEAPRAGGGLADQMLGAFKRLIGPRSNGRR